MWMGGFFGEGKGTQKGGGSAVVLSRAVFNAPSRSLLCFAPDNLEELLVAIPAQWERLAAKVADGSAWKQNRRNKVDLDARLRYVAACVSLLVRVVQVARCLCVWGGV